MRNTEVSHKTFTSNTRAGARTSAIAQFAINIDINFGKIQKGLEAMLIELSPRVVVVYGAMPKDVFADYLDYADFHRFNDWISDKKGNYVRRIIADQQYFDF